MVIQNQSKLGEGSTMPTDPHHTPTILQPSSSQPQKTPKPKKPKRKDTQVPQPSGLTESVADDVVHKELGDSLMRAATTDSSLEVEQDNGNITKTQSKATPNEPSYQGTDSGGGPRVESSKDEESLGEDASKHGRRIDVDEDITLVNDADNEMFDVDDLGGEEVFVAIQNDNVVEEVVNASQIYMLVEKKYPLTLPTLSMMPEKNLQIDYESVMAYQLCRLIKKQRKNSESNSIFKKHYALWQVIEFGDSYKAPPEETGKGPTVRTTLLLALPDEHQLRFSKYETAKELWEAILKTFGGNEATKKTKKIQLKLQYGNFKTEGSKILEQTFNGLQTILSHLEFMDVEIEQDDLNRKFLTSLAPEWLMYTIVWRNRDDLDTMSLDDVYNHLKVYEPEVQKKLGSNSQNMAFISSSNTSSEKGEVHTASVPTACIQVSTTSTDVAAASLSHDTISADEVPTEFALMAKSSSSLDNEIKKEKERLDNKLTGFENASKDLDNLLGSQRSYKNKEGLGYSAVPPPPAQIYSPPKKDLS
nr:hypothetical protein [Tanacetum cinerariifolium]